MSLGSLLCRVWRFLLGAMETALKVATEALRSLAKFVVDVLGDLLDIGGSLLKNPLIWLAGGLALWWFLGRDEDSEETSAGSVDYSRYGTLDRTAPEVN